MNNSALKGLELNNVHVLYVYFSGFSSTVIEYTYIIWYTNIIIYFADNIPFSVPLSGYNMLCQEVCSV